MVAVDPRRGEVPRPPQRPAAAAAAAAVAGAAEEVVAVEREGGVAVAVGDGGNGGDDVCGAAEAVERGTAQRGQGVVVRGEGEGLHEPPAAVERRRRFIFRPF
jgi:hypothetical protein